ncbi:ABC transporter substrate-binding protein [Roseobacter litoralis]|uniref:ABC transporter substrate-binding protein n=1 Tax=Roseobacter litoralis (strain ATCC 49566 / DSM 6996 / JCM 21268 / NBRC 15278 / OCh 149) TaxID=391595 RepID=F7ZJM4_ROSLO|nr:hypothetical protein [Roseobacter litoralis]AEI93855.1 hypothetical protein RLO149_c018670 [Roseobacter litoralis Och 149]
MIRVLSIIVILTLLGGALTYHAGKPRVLVLQSYEPDYAWTAGVIEGLDRVTRSWSDVHLNAHYMYTKKFSDADSLRRAGVQAGNAVERWKPDVVIAIDNLAHALVMQDYANHPTIKIVYAGINGPVSAFGYDSATNVTGIRENRAMGPVRDAIAALRQTGVASAPWDGSRPIRIRYVMDRSVSVIRDRPNVDGFDWSPLVYTASVAVDNYPAWQEEVRRSEGMADIIIVTNYRQLKRSDTEAGFVPAQEVMAWTEANAGIPVIGMNVFNTEDGATFSVGASPIEQGQVAAELAGLLISGQAATEIPARDNLQFLVSMSQERLARHGLMLPQVYEAFARATNTFER